MWSKALFLSILVLASCSPADRGCSESEKEDTRSAVKVAFLEWKESLNYMDYEMIDHKYHALQQCVAEAQPCLLIDSMATIRIDSINRAYTVSSPQSDMIQRAEQLTRSLEKEIFKEAK